MQLICSALMILIMATGCASTARVPSADLRHSPPAPENMPLERSDLERTAFYKAHKIEAVSMGQIQVNGIFYDQTSSKTYLQFYCPPPCKAARFLDAAQRKPTWGPKPFLIAVPAGLVIGTGVGVVVGFLSALGHSADVNAFSNGIAIGSAGGLALGTVGALAYRGLASGKNDRAGLRAQELFNQQLFRGLELEIVPSRGGGALSARLHF